MSILIKGLEMPTEGEYSMKLYVCSDGSAYMDVASFPVDKDKFEAVPVLPHGRLIDADALVLPTKLNDWNSVTEYIRNITDVWGAIDAAPTIIPAEEGET